MKKLVVPRFAAEAEEAKWWDDHMGVVEQNLVQAIKGGVARRGGPRRVIRERRQSKNITIRVAIADIERARALAEKKGIGYQTYMKMLLKEALDRDSRRAGIAGEPSRAQGPSRDEQPVPRPRKDRAINPPSAKRLRPPRDAWRGQPAGRARDGPAGSAPAPSS